MYWVRFADSASALPAWLHTTTIIALHVVGHTAESRRVEIISLP